MKTKIAVLALIAVTAGVFTYSRTQRALPSDLRDAVGEEIKNTSGVPFAEMKIAKKTAEPVKLSGDFKSAPKAKTTEAKKSDAINSKVPALLAEQKVRIASPRAKDVTKVLVTAGTCAGVAMVVVGGAMAVGVTVAAAPVIVGAATLAGVVVGVYQLYHP